MKVAGRIALQSLFMRELIWVEAMCGQISGDMLWSKKRLFVKTGDCLHFA